MRLTVRTDSPVSRGSLHRLCFATPVILFACAAFGLATWSVIEARNPDPIEVTTFPHSHLGLSKGHHTLYATLFNPRFQAVYVAVLSLDDCGCISDQDRRWVVIGPLQSAKFPFDVEVTERVRESGTGTFSAKLRLAGVPYLFHKDFSYLVLANSSASRPVTTQNSLEKT